MLFGLSPRDLPTIVTACLLLSLYLFLPACLPAKLPPPTAPNKNAVASCLPFLLFLSTELCLSRPSLLSHFGFPLGPLLTHHVVQVLAAGGTLRGLQYPKHGYIFGVHHGS